MNKKKFPKAIVQATDGLSAAGVASAIDEFRLTPRTGWSTPGSETTPQKTQETSNVVPMTPAAQGSCGRVLAVPSSAAMRGESSQNQERRTKALTIVNRHAAYSAAGGLIPLPVANFAGVTAIIVRMVKALSTHYGVPFERDRARVIVIGLIGGAIPSGAVAVTSSAFFYALPPSLVVAAAVSSAAAAAYTRRIGLIFIEHFESGATLGEFPSAASR